MDAEKQERFLHNRSWKILDQRSSVASMNMNMNMNIISSSNYSTNTTVAATEYGASRPLYHHPSASPTNIHELMSTTSTPTPTPTTALTPKPQPPNCKYLITFLNSTHHFNHDPVLSKVVPWVTVVIEGRSICQRIDLLQHNSYESLARALRKMFVDKEEDNTDTHNELGLSTTEAAAVLSSPPPPSSSSSCAGIASDQYYHAQQHHQLQQLDLSNAVPGHIIAYEDMENDLLLAGDLSWKDFVRVAKRIRILPAKPSAKKRREGSILKLSNT